MFGAEFVEWKRDTHVLLERNPAYWRTDANGTQLPYLDRLVFKPFPDENVRLTNVRTGDARALAAVSPDHGLNPKRGVTPPGAEGTRRRSWRRGARPRRPSVMSKGRITFVGEPAELEGDDAVLAFS